jgi:hypothetical protein
VSVGEGGTNSTAALSNNRVVVSSAGAMVEASAITASRALISDTNGLPTHSATTNTELGYLSGVTSALQTQLNAKQATLTSPLSVANGGTGLATAAFPTWTKYTVAHTALQTAATTNNISLFILPAKTMIHKVVVKHSTAFAGGAIATYTVSVGIIGTLAKYIAAFDVFQAVSSTAFSIAAATVNAGVEDFSSGVAIQIAAISTVANLNATTQGSVDVWVLTSLLP